jgi:hypothetical protein
LVVTAAVCMEVSDWVDPPGPTPMAGFVGDMLLIGVWVLGHSLTLYFVERDAEA